MGDIGAKPTPCIPFTPWYLHNETASRPIMVLDPMLRRGDDRPGTVISPRRGRQGRESWEVKVTQARAKAQEGSDPRFLTKRNLPSEKMPNIVWSERYSVKVKKLDKQHMRMAELVNTLNDSINSQENRNSVIEGFTELIKYTGDHFSAEEALMKEHGYPSYKKHKKEHKNLINLLRDIRRQFKKESKSFSDFDYDLAKDWLVIHADWFAVHLSHSDKELGSFLHKKGIK
jgi:hemerythrin